jgi:hypothetical protein
MEDKLQTNKNSHLYDEVDISDLLKGISIYIKKI